MKQIRIFEIIKKRRLTYVAMIFVLLFGVGVGYVISVFRGAKKIEAANFTIDRYIRSTDTSYDSMGAIASNITISSGATVTIDGKHQFNNLTVKNGAVLTTTDYNRYGVELPSNDPNDQFSLLSGKDGAVAKYAFIVRGFINTGTKHDYVYSAVSGTQTSLGKPNGFRVQGNTEINFYQAVPVDSVYNADYFASSVFINNAFSAYTTSPYYYEQYTDANSSNSNPLIPFELRYTTNNSSIDSSFGISYCDPAGDCTAIANNSYVKAIDIASSFESLATPQIKTLNAWQGLGDTPSLPVINSGFTTANYSTFAGLIDTYRSGDGYDSTKFSLVSNYNFTNDKKVYLKNYDANILISPTLVEYSNQYENANAPAGSSLWRGYMRFDSTNLYNSPLSFRINTAGAVDRNFPTISRGLYNSLTKKTKTEITVAGIFTVENGGMVNVNGKGFVATSNTDEGVGPGASKLASDWGASHSGSGGKASSATYDIAISEPQLPGSAISETVWSGSIGSRFGYGGGYIKISALTNKINTGSWISANGVTGYYCSQGSSGGSVILEDSNPRSIYEGFITALGGGTNRPTGEKCPYSGGGGGHIYIKTATDPSLLGVKQAIQLSQNYYVLPSSVLVNSYDSTGLKNIGLIDGKLISASGGKSEGSLTLVGKTSNTGGGPGIDGDYGIVRIVGSGPTIVSIKKSLSKICQEGDTLCATSSPYTVKPGDKLNVALLVKNLTPGVSITIKDEIFNDGASRYFSKAIDGSWNKTPATSTPSEITWNLIPTTTTDTLTYSILVQ